MTQAQARLRLRQYRSGDFEAFAALNADPRVRVDVGGPLPMELAREHFAGWLGADASSPSLGLAIERLADAAYLGHAWWIADGGPESPEIGLLLGHAHWHQGYGSEALGLLFARACSQFQPRRLFASVDAGSPRAIAMLERAGWRRERLAEYADGLYIVYARAAEV